MVQISQIINPQERFKCDKVAEMSYEIFGFYLQENYRRFGQYKSKEMCAISVSIVWLNYNFNNCNGLEMTDQLLIIFCLYTDFT